MIRRILENRLAGLPKSVLLLGPRQVGKSTLCRGQSPDLEINLADQSTFNQFLKDPGLLTRIVSGNNKATLILLDEIQRIPDLLHTVQSIVDRDAQKRFLLTGSSARKLKRGKANLLPGRVFIEYLPPLVYWEIAEDFNLDRALSLGQLPEIYLQDYGSDLLHAYTAGYLREEIQAEALTKDLGAYSRFLDLAAELSGHYINYAKIASDSEINKETIRRYMQILEDTLLIERIPGYTAVDQNRRVRQKDRFIFFDLGVRNAILDKHEGSFSNTELGNLFEQWLILQCVYYKRLNRLRWRLMSYRDSGGIEVDMILETATGLKAIEIKFGNRVSGKMFKNLVRFAEVCKQPCEKIIVYRGEFTQQFEHGTAIPYKIFLEEILPGWDNE